MTDRDAIAEATSSIFGTPEEQAAREERERQRIAETRTIVIPFTMFGAAVFVIHAHGGCGRFWVRVDNITNGETTDSGSFLNIHAAAEEVRKLVSAFRSIGAAFPANTEARIISFHGA